MKTALATFALTTFAFGYVLACRPIFRIYESECCGDDYVEVAREWIGVNNEPNLTAQGLKHNYINSCPEGVWMGYEEANYTGRSYLLYSYGNYDHLNQCQYENTGRKYRSVKIVGSTVSYTDSALSTFTMDRGIVIGGDETYLNDTRNLPGGSFTRIVITGNQEVELFTSGYFSGLSVCVGPNNGNIYSWTGFENVNNNRNGSYIFTQLSDLNDIFGTNEFNSFTFGCKENTNTLLDVIRASKH